MLAAGTSAGGVTPGTLTPVAPAALFAIDAVTAGLVLAIGTTDESVDGCDANGIGKERSETWVADW